MIPHPARCSPLVLALLAFAASVASANPTLGFREDFPTASGIGTWAGGGILSNPGTGGYWGDGDGYLVVERDVPDRLGANSIGPEYSGDWTASGITQIRLWLTDTGAADPLEIHVGIGNQTNFWQYDPGFSPVSGAWGEYVVDLTNSGAFTQTIGSSPFATALQTTDRVLIRHDLFPYFQVPDLLQGDFGVDHVLLTNGLVGVGSAPGPSGRPIELSRPYPNPSRGPVTLAVSSAERTPITIEIVDVGGRRVWHAELTAAAGSRLWMWDGRDDQGTRVPPGVYRARALGSSGGMSQPLIRVH